MKPSALLREPARLVMHLNEGFTKVTLERTGGSGLADGGVCWDIPTERIPFHLRAIGSRFLVVCQTYQPEPTIPQRQWPSGSFYSRAAEMLTGTDELPIDTRPRSPAGIYPYFLR